MKILFIFNPQAANGKAKNLLPQIESYLNNHNLKYELQLTEYPHHANEIAANMDFSKYDGIAAAGGDGTLFDVINGYYKNSSDK